uniref:Sm domain-containing protein n=1 Tax=Paramoeba aestuarina TaxID=180227 RepID=A0A7S4K9D7_9EUKA
MTIQLTRFLMKIPNETVTLELKDGSSVSGRIVGVDKMMNTHLKDVKIKRNHSLDIQLEQLTVRGNTIRYYQLPDVINLDACLKNLSSQNKQEKPRKKQKVNSAQAQ